MFVAVGSAFLSLFASTLAAYAIERLRFRGSPCVGLGIYLAYLVPPSILFIPLATVVVQFGLFDSPMAPDPGLPDLPGAVLHLAVDQLAPPSPIPYELGGMRWSTARPG